MKRTLVYCIAILFALFGCEQLTENEASVPQPKAVEDAEGLEAAFADPGVQLIEIQNNINADTLSLTVPSGDKTIYIPGGKETAIGSLELSAGSHVKIMNGSGGTSKSAGGALAAAYSEQNYDGWATLVIWNNFKIPGGATFDLAGEVRLVFHVAEVDGDLRADLEDSLLGAGEEAPVITGKGKVQTSKDAEAKKPELAATGIKTSGEHKALVTITAAGTGIMAKGEKRQFTANRTVTWSVEGMPDEEGADTKSAGTTITAGGLLTIGAGETNITLTIKAMSGENTVAETVRVKGWKAIAGIKNIFGNFPVNGVAYGNGIWVAVGGGSNKDGAKMAYSVDGESWTRANPTSAMSKAKDIDKALNNVIYDGPEGGKKFIAFGKVRIMPSSKDGKVWTDAKVLTNDVEFESFCGAYGNGMFIAAGHTAWPEVDDQFSAATSEDGTLWKWTIQEGEIGSIHSSYSPLYSSPYIGYGIAFGNGKFIVPFGPNAAIAKMTSGTDMALAANKEITVGDLTIPAKGYPADFTSAPSFKKAVFAGGQWIACGEGGVLAFSPDTVTWSPVVVGVFNNKTITSIASGGGRLAIGGEGGKFAYTPLPASTSSEWTLVTVGNGTVSAICFGGNKVIAAGPGGWLAVAHGETLEK
jgi:hypothetical protein